MSIRYFLLVEVQSCIWQSPDVMPEVDIAYSIEHFGCESYDLATTEAAKILAELGAKENCPDVRLIEENCPDVRPIEQCAVCQEDFDTRQPHHTLTLSKEAGAADNPEVLECRCLARLCQHCGSVFEGSLWS